VSGTPGEFMDVQQAEALSHRCERLEHGPTLHLIKRSRMIIACCLFRLGKQLIQRRKGHPQSCGQLASKPRQRSVCPDSHRPTVDRSTPRR